jgi:formate-dependent nitrite reductase membrane component NrfD
MVVVTPPPADQLSAFYRTGLIEAVLFLLLFLVAFGALTILARDRWTRFSSTESMLVRLAVATLVASIALGGISGVVLNLVQGAAFSDTSLTPTASRNQAILGIGLALAVTVIGIVRIEMYHRRLAIPSVEEDEAQWKVEPPEAAGGL